ncbi:hypothetical protein QMZ05_11680 [Bradyrhizobium sp. INPA03-11B]|uniref:hypothetical protein n=1 Tax=Bradyrhizobium sp. INPA03-11B TaxID=418598 RepID=UPI00338EDDC2
MTGRKSHPVRTAGNIDIKFQKLVVAIWDEMVGGTAMIGLIPLRPDGGAVIARYALAAARICCNYDPAR